MTVERKPNRGPSAGPENRRALIAAARAVFAEDGYDAPLSRIAKRAGVGQGSLYRHFPDRQSIALAVFDENLADLEAFIADPDRTLDDLFAKLISQSIAHSSLIDFMMRERADDAVVDLGGRLRTIVELAVEHERAAGRLASAASTDDVLLAVSLIAALVSRTPPADRRAVAERAWALLHAGMGAARPANG
ncbi:TetR family transcriptional regulator [Agromyces seonyuensis]|uniref:TetR family transcriptional regulator n=1 Tax=Agromyces seonyuensis TaxID=2662446 RepID=A0A6I4NXF1_9MICO|nr:TetR family transcriptional regulator [Agromyces seonyuensis]